MPESARVAVLEAGLRQFFLAAAADPDTTRTAPILFAADHLAGLDKARTYVATCGSGDACTTSDDVVCVEHELRGPVQEEASRRGDGCGGEGSGCGSGGDGRGEGCGGGGCAGGE